MCKFKMRIIIRVFLLACLIALVRAEENSTATTTEKAAVDAVDNGTITESQESSRPQRSIGKLTRLLLGGTYVMVQLGQMPSNHPLVRYPEPVHEAKGKEVLAAVPGQLIKAHISGLPSPLVASRGFSSQPAPLYQQIHEGDKAQAVDQPLASLMVSNSQSNSYYSGQEESVQQTTYPQPQHQAHSAGNYPPGHYDHEQHQRYHEAESPQPSGANPYDATYTGSGRGTKDSNRHDFHGPLPDSSGPAPQSYSYPSYDYPGEGYYTASEQSYQHETPHPAPPTSYQHPPPDYQPLPQAHHSQATQQAEIPFPKGQKTRGGPPTQTYPSTPHQGSHGPPNPIIKIEHAPAYSQPESFYESGYSDYQNPDSFPPPGQRRGDRIRLNPAPADTRGYARPESSYSHSEPSHSSQPEPSYPNSPETSYSHPEPSISRPEPGYSQPDPGYSQHSPSFSPASPVHGEPEQGYSQPSPSNAQHVISYSQPNPGYSQPDPGVPEPHPGFLFPNDPNYSQHAPQESIATYSKILPSTAIISMPVREEEPKRKLKRPYLLDHPLVIPPPEFKKPPWSGRPRFENPPENRPVNFYKMRYSPLRMRFHNAPNTQFSKPLIALPSNGPQRNKPYPHLNPHYPLLPSASPIVNLPLSVNGPTVNYPPPNPTQQNYPLESPSNQHPPTNHPPQDNFSASSTHHPELNKNYAKHSVGNRPLPNVSPSESSYPYDQPSPTTYPIRDSILPPDNGPKKHPQSSTPKYAQLEDDSYPRVYVHPTPENYPPSNSDRSFTKNNSPRHQISYSSKNNRSKNKSYKPTSHSRPKGYSSSSKSYSKSTRPSASSYKSKSKDPTKSSKYYKNSVPRSSKNYRKPPPPTSYPKFSEKSSIHYKSETSSNYYYKHGRGPSAHPKYHGPDYKHGELSSYSKFPHGSTERFKYSEAPTKYYKNSESPVSIYPKPSGTFYLEHPGSASYYPTNPEKMSFPHKNPELVSQHSKSSETMPHYPKYPETMSFPNKNPELVSHHPRSSETVPHYPRNPETISFSHQNPELVSNHPKSSETVPHYPQNPETISFPHRNPELVSHHPKSSETVPYYPQNPETVSYNTPAHETGSSYPKNPETVSYYPKNPEAVSYYPKISESVFVHPKNIPSNPIYSHSSDKVSLEISPSYYISSEVLSDYYKQFEQPTPQPVNYSPPGKFANYQNSNEYLSQSFSKKSLFNNNETKSPHNSTITSYTYHHRMFDSIRNHTNNSRQNVSHQKQSRRQYRKADYYSDDNPTKLTSTSPPATTTIPAAATTVTIETTTPVVTITTLKNVLIFNSSSLSDIQFEETTTNLISDDIDTNTTTAESSTLGL